MSYKVEVSSKDQESLLLGTLADWSRQEHDVHLVSTEGHKIFSHKVILAFYSSVLREVLAEPIHALTNNPVTIFLPASVSTISSLIQILVKGKLDRNQTDDISVTEEIKEVSKAMGIDLKNCLVEGRKPSSSGSRRTAIMLPLKKRSPEGVPMPKPYKIVPKSLKIKPVHQQLATKKSKIKKEPISEEISISATKTLNIGKRGFKSKYLAKSGKFACDVCNKEFAKVKGLYKHRRRVHKIKRLPTPQPEEKYPNFVQETENGLSELDINEMPTDEEIGYENTLDILESTVQEE